MLNVEHFAWDTNDFSSLFKGCLSPSRFVQIFNTQISEIMTDSPPAKRQKIAPMIPASHSARNWEEQDDDFSVSKMDKAIQTYFQGNFIKYLCMAYLSTLSYPITI